MRSLLVLALVGCGGGGQTPGGDDDEPPTGPIEVHVAFFDLSPAPSIEVVFHDRDGLVVSVAETDANGVVTLDEVDGVEMVTVQAVNPNGGEREVSTKVGIQPGQKPQFIFSFNAFSVPPPPPFMRDFAVNLPANPPTSDSFTVDFMCETYGTPSLASTHTMLNDCRRDDGKLDVIAFAKLGTDQVAFSLLSDVDIAASGTTTLNFSAWSTNFTTIALDWTNAPAGITNAGTQFAVGYSGRKNERRPFPFEQGPLAAGATVSRSYRFDGGATTIIPGIEVRFGETQPRGSAFFATAIAPTSTTQFDLDATLLARITGVSMSADAITWTQEGPHDDASTGFVFFSFTGGSWVIQIPPDDATSVTIPELPDFTPAGISEPGVVFEFDSYAPTYQDQLERNTFDVGELFVENSTRFPG